MRSVQAEGDVNNQIRVGINSNEITHRITTASGMPGRWTWDLNEAFLIPRSIRVL
jgi:hypothetical protein